MKTKVFPNCGNAPKMGAVVDLTIALADRDSEKVANLVREDFVFFNINGSDEIRYDELASKLANRPEVSEIIIENGLSHGNGAMCEGIMTFVDGDELYFCAVATFVSTAKNALIKKLHMYYVEK